MNQEKNKQDKTLGIVVLIITLVALNILFKVSALVGFIIYLVAFGISLHRLKQEVAYDSSFSIGYFIKNFKSSEFWTQGIFTIVVAIIPIIVCIAAYRWIYTDTIRQVDAIYNSIDYDF